MTNLIVKDFLAKLLASESIAVVHNNVKTASFDLKNRILTLPIWQNMSNDLYDMLIGHEVAHAIDTPADAWEYFVKKYAGKKQGAFHSCLNIVEDARIERNIQVRYPGLRPNFRKAYRELKDELFAEILEKPRDELCLADRVNLYFKLEKSGEMDIGIPFNKTEQNLVDRIAKVDKFFGVFKLAEELLALSKLEAQAKDQDVGDEGDEEIEIEIEIDEEDLGQYGQCGEAGEGGNVKVKIKRKSKSDEQDDLFDEKDESKAEGGDGDGEDSENGSEGSDQQAGGKESNGGTKKKIKVKISRKGGLDGIEGETQGLLDEYKEDKADTSNHNVVGYAKIGDMDWDRYTHSFEKLLGKFRRANDGYAGTGKTRWLSEQTPMISFMVNAFNRKKAARRYENRKVNKTGILNMNKLHSYKLTDNVFKSSTVFKKHKKHCLMMFIDLSSSMNDNVKGAAKQLLNLTSFCDKLNIPYRVYGFTSGGYGYGGQPVNTSDTFKTTPDAEYSTVVPENHAKFYEFFNERMSRHQKEEMAQYIWNEWVRRSTSVISMGGTPMNDGLHRAINELPEFMQKTGTEIGHVVFLTDGGDNGSNRIMTNAKWNHAGQWVVVHNNKQYEYGGANGSLKFYREVLEDTCGAAMVNFNITDYMDGTVEESPFTDGWSKEFMIKLGVLTSIGDSKLKELNDENFNEYTKRYGAWMKNKRKVQVILDKFIDTISKSL